MLWVVVVGMYLLFWGSFFIFNFQLLKNLSYPRKIIQRGKEVDTSSYRFVICVLFWYFHFLLCFLLSWNFCCW